MSLVRVSQPSRPVGRLANRLLLSVLAAGFCLSLGACDQSEKTRQVIDQRAGEAQTSLDKAQKAPSPSVNYDPLTVTSKLWNGNAALRMQRGMPLPAGLEAPRGVTLVSADPMSMNEILSAITAQTGLPVRISSMTIKGQQGAQASTAEMPISYEGPLSGLLERLSAFYGVSWRYDGSAITISRYETRIFAIEALPGTQKLNEGMQDDESSGGSGGGSSGGSSGGGSGGSSGGGGSSSSQNTLTQNSQITMDLKYWDELGQVLTSVLAGQGTAVVSPTMGTVTVTTTPDVMATVADYLGKENKRLSRQIAINVQIYSVNLGQSEDFNIAFTGFLKNLAKFSGLNYTSAAAPTIANTALTSGNFGQLSLAILNGPNDPTAHAGDIFNALSTIGDTSEVAQFPMTTLNNHPISRRVGTDTTYISQVTQNTTATTSTQTITTPTTSTIHDGFSLQLTPRLLDDGRILLQYSLSLIGLDKMVNNPTYGIDLPITDNRLFVQQSMLRSGQTLMIGGVDQEKLAQNKNGVLSPDNFLLGGGVSSDSNHFMMFMAITPQVLNGATDEEHG